MLGLDRITINGTTFLNLIGTGGAFITGTAAPASGERASLKLSTAEDELNTRIDFDASKNWTGEKFKILV